MKQFTLLITTLFSTLLATAQAHLPETCSLTNGPYVFHTTEDGFTVVWQTDADAIGWVEIAPDDSTHFYAESRPRYYDSHLGICRKGRMHRVRINGLEPNTTYRFRVMHRGILLNEGNKRIILDEGSGSSVYPHEPYHIRTADPTKESTCFWMINDIHSNDSLFKRLIARAPEERPDFIFLNGDLASQIDDENTLWKACLSSASEVLSPAGIPLEAARGNHENRGTCPLNWSDYFPTPNQETYYTFRQGPAFFIVLDGGEDKPDNDQRYFGTGDWDTYRRDQARWLNKVVNSREFQEAAVKIVFIHMPPAAHDGWYGEKQISRLFVPELAGKGIDLMLCAHYHSYAWIDDTSRGTEYPILINSNVDCLRVHADKEKIDLQVVDADGKVIHRHHIDNKK